MIYKEKFIRLLQFIVRIFLITSLGAIALYFLTSFIFSGLEFTYLLLLIPVILVVLFGMVAFILSEILRFQGMNESEVAYRYTRKELFSLYGRSFSVVACGLTLAILFGYEHRTDLGPFPEYLFFFLDLILTLYAIGSIVKSEKLRELNMRRIQSENALLKSQLNPHFLYNTLNNIDALIAFDTDKASEAVLKLSSLLRYMTYQGNLRFVSLHEEIIHLEEYVSLQRLRLENPEAISFESELQTENIQVVPMLLMPFVENIFKHATDKTSEGAIKIKIHADSHRMSYYSANEYKPQTLAKKEKDGGVGMYVVKRRLKLLYPGRHELIVNQCDRRYEVYLNHYFK
ncbi:MAG: histidine kinase [Bacteroidales bacterium]